MSGLQIATDIVALVFMGVLLIIMIAILITALKIKRKVNKVQQDIEYKLAMVKSLPYIGGRFLNSVKRH